MTAAMTLDLDAYFERIGYSGPVSPGLDTLKALHRLHPQAISFDGLSPFLGDPVNLEIDALQEKLVQRRRGGYCFEQNVLFWEVLKRIGFHVTGLTARVRLNWPADVITPRGHMALLVALPEGHYIADVGYGKLTLTAPCRLQANVEQSTPHEPVRIIELGDGISALQARLAAEWKTLYTFGLEEAFLPDYAVLNWYYSTHPESPFLTSLMMGRPQPGARHALLNRRYSVQDLTGRSEVRELGSVYQLRQALIDGFGVDIAHTKTLDGRFQRLLATGS